MKIVEEEEEEVAEIQPDPLHQLILHFSHNALTERRWDGYDSAFKQLANFFLITSRSHITYFAPWPVLIFVYPSFWGICCDNCLTFNQYQFVCFVYFNQQNIWY